MKRILVADDHPVVREGLKQIIARTSDLRVAGEAATGQEIFDQLRAGTWDAVVLDISLGEESGLDLLGRIKGLYPHLPVLLLSVYGEPEFAIRALKMSASGYLPKEAAPEILAEALRKVVSGGTFVSPALAESLALRLRRMQDLPHERLSDREFQILLKLGEGLTVTEIARAFNLSVKTVSAHRRNILDKMQMRTTAQLIRYVVENRLTERKPA